MKKFNWKRFRQARIDAGFSLETFARAMQEHAPSTRKSHVWAWEQGKQPGGRFVAAMCAVLGCGFDFFYR